MTCSSCRITVCITRYADQSQEWLAESGLCLRDLRASTKRPASARRAKDFIGKFLSFLVIFLTLWTPLLVAQAERNRLYFKTVVNPLGFAKSGLSAGIDQADDKPREWEQGASGYGRRFANILGQNSIQRTVSYGL
jgi:hypothetical protein